jgi:hypothetical protein
MKKITDKQTRIVNICYKSCENMDCFFVQIYCEQLNINTNTCQRTFDMQL